MSTNVMSYLFLEKQQRQLVGEFGNDIKSKSGTAMRWLSTVFLLAATTIRRMSKLKKKMEMSKTERERGCMYSNVHMNCMERALCLRE